MTWHDSVNERIRAIEIVNSGSLTLRDLCNQASDAAAVAQRWGLPRLLTDNAALETEFSMVDLLHLVGFHDQLPYVRTARLAVVRPARPRANRHSVFYEIAAANRGFRLRVFGLRADAGARMLRSRVVPGAAGASHVARVDSNAAATDRSGPG